MNCAICRSDFTQPVFTKEGYDLVRCKVDGHTYVRNAPSQQELAKLYGQGYFEGKFGGYRHNVFEQKVMHLAKAGRKVEKVRGFVPSGRILDVGCGPGFFVYQARRSGFDVQGADISPTAVDYARKELGLNIWMGDFLDFPTNGKFDVVSMFSYLEHVPESGLNLDKARELLVDDGLLALALPNLMSASRLVKGRNWRGFSFPEHLHLFNARNLNKLLTQSGFKMMETRLRDKNIFRDTAYYFARKL